MKSFNIEDGKVTMDSVPTYGWLRKEDVLYYLMTTKMTWEDHLKYYKTPVNNEEENKIHELQGRILALDMAINEIEKA